MKAQIVMLVAITLIGLGAAYFLVSGKPAEPVDHSEPAEESVNTLKERQELMRRWNDEKDADKRIAILEEAASKQWISYDRDVLRKAMVSDPEESVRIRALELEIDVARQSERKQEGMVYTLRHALESTTGEVQHKALIAAREHPYADLLEPILSIAQSENPNWLRAHKALSVIDHDRARAQVLATASRSDLSVAERRQAIALLAMTRDPRAVPLLETLVGDENYAEIAKAVLEELQTDSGNQPFAR
jgi:hypothetical protein